MASGPSPSSATLARNAGSSSGSSARRRHAVGLSAKSWRLSAPIARARSAARTIPCPRGRCAPSRRPPGSPGRGSAARGSAGSGVAERALALAAGRAGAAAGAERRADICRIVQEPGPRGGTARRFAPRRAPARQATLSGRGPPALRVVAGDHRLDQPEVAVPAPIEHVDALVLRVHEDEEGVAERLHLGDRVLLEHRLEREPLRLDHPALAASVGGPVRDPREDPLLLGPAAADPRLLAVVHRAPLDLVHDLVDRRLVRDGVGATAQCLAVDHEGDLGDPRVVGAPMVLHGDLEDRFRPVIQEALQAPHLPLGVLPHGVRDIEVLALDDRPHG